MKKAVVLLSGGLDSATVMAMVKDSGFDTFALSFRYGQRHAIELQAASKMAAIFNVTLHRVIDIDLRQFGASALTDDIDVPKGTAADDIGNHIPITYVPGRNTIFLSFAMAWAEVLDAHDIFIGINALDYSGYPDCRPEYIASFQAMANLATRAGVEGKSPLTIHTPLINMTKAEIISAGTALGVEYGSTISCYDPDDQGRACGECDSCQLRKKGFSDAGLEDPAPYQAAP